MLGLLLLLQVFVSCLWLGHSEVVNNFPDQCIQFFYEQTPPSDSVCPTNVVRICQFYNNSYRFVTLYDRRRRIPVYSAYIYNPGKGDRSDSWFVEPQLINQNYEKDMDEVNSMKRKYGIDLKEIGQSQAIEEDYKDAMLVDNGHLCPSGHQTGNDGKFATFTLTNIVPQYSTLNQGAWQNYEDVTMRKKTKGCETTYVIMGAVPGNTYISDGRVNVPSHIWSAACCLKKGKPFATWGAIAENKRGNNKVEIIELGDLQNRLAGLYERGRVTLFSNSCA